MFATEKAKLAFPVLLQETVSTTSKDELSISLAKTVVPILGQLGEPGQFAWTIRDHATNWVGAEMLTGVSDAADSVPIIQILILAPDTATKIAILLAVVTSPHFRPFPRWWKPVLEATLPDAQAEFVAHLSQRDQAPHEPTSLMKFFNVARTAQVNFAPLHQAIADAIASEKFGIDDLAARCIRPDSASSFTTDQMAFDIIAPPGHYPWYDDPEGEFPDDLFKWVGRRTVAAGRITQPA
ncbi:hypothetical protein CH300_18740 [Rhodococcus sp. 15-1154-1]|nr:hypothetical protein CH300_18740 [Rhodococcus sp. 15-1154-1]